MRIVITINCENDAFEGDPLPEVQGILATVPAKFLRILQRKPGCVCTAPEADDKLLDRNGNTVGHIRVYEDKPSSPALNLIIAPKECDRMMERPHPLADGWCNQDTHTFSIYLMQEKEAYDFLCDLIKRGKYRKTPALYSSAKTFCEGFYTRRKMEQMDDDYTGGPINLREIIDNLVDEITPTEPQPQAKKA